MVVFLPQRGNGIPEISKLTCPVYATGRGHHPV